jgi:hypothetical protein
MQNGISDRVFAGVSVKSNDAAGTRYNDRSLEISCWPTISHAVYAPLDLYSRAPDSLLPNRELA